MSTSGTSERPSFTRPVELPDDANDHTITKASGRVQLPLHVRWSGPPKTYDLDDRQDRSRVYEQVLREGAPEDIRFYIDVEQLLDLWDEPVLPQYVRRAWADWLLQRTPVSPVTQVR
jgi:hypothetical protein